MLIEKAVEVPLSAAGVFTRVSSLEYVAGSLPGAQITEADGDVHRGILTVRVGPITANYEGFAEITSIDSELRRLTIATSGKDRGNTGGVEAEFTVQVEEVGPSASRLEVAADVRLRGLAAQFGRGATDGIIGSLVAQFVENLVQDSQAVDPLAPAVVASPADGPQSTATQGQPRAVPRSAASHQTPSGSSASPSLDLVGLVASAFGPRLKSLSFGIGLGLIAGSLVRRVTRNPSPLVVEVELVTRP